MQQEATITSVPARRIPSLDGWRGIAIALVLFDHVQYAIFHRYLVPWAQTGQHGVTIFFVISGFLITTKLLEGPIDLRSFYMRRAFRLMPVAWTFLAAMLVFDQGLHSHFISVSEVLACLLFYRNFVGVSDGGVAGHFWSLSLEEQFYLVWPVILLLAGVRRARWIAVALALACAAYRFHFWGYYDRNLWNGQTQVRCDALLVGCLLALIVAEPRLVAITARWSRRIAVPAAATIIVCLVRFHWLVPLYECIAIAVLLAVSVLQPRGGFARFLSFKPLAWLGAVSYSVYVWQSLFMLPWPSTAQPWLFGLVLPLFAAASFYWIEQPLARLGRRLSHPFPAGSGYVGELRGSRRGLSGGPLPVQQK